jgi:hypothetical protein
VGYNFYSSTEEVLRDWDGSGLVHSGWTFWKWLEFVYNELPAPGYFDLEAGEHFAKLYVWVKQEKTKGRKDDWMMLTFGGLPDAYTGWGFAQEGQFVNEFLWQDLYPKSPADVQTEITGINSVAFWESVKTDPLFRKRPEALFNSNAGSLMDDDCTTISGLPANDVTTGCRFDDWLLSSAFPATTYSMGANPQPDASWASRNSDMSSSEYMTSIALWPRYCREPSSSGQDRGEWHHSDFRDVAYTHVHKLFKKWLEITMGD